MDDIVIRFYEELNDFLPNYKRKKAYSAPYLGKQSVKDLIESQGVPHSEVDLILANKESVDFNYIVVPGDYISVYPVFETFDITRINKLRRAPLRSLKFIIDVNLGRLAKYLRLLGFDAEYRNDLKDAEIVEISNNENRIILTRDVGVLKRGRVERGYWLRSDNPNEQIKEVAKRFNLAKEASPLKYCLKCNGEIKPVSKSEIGDKLEPNTSKYYNEFYICSKCDSIYWEGSHIKRMRAQIDDFLGDDFPNDK